MTAQDTPLSPTDWLARFGDAPPGAATLTLLTGSRGCGKTTWCSELIRQGRAAGMRPEGLISPAVMAGDQKVGIDLLNVASGERRHLAVQRLAAERDPVWSANTQNWRFTLETFAWGNDILAQIHTPALFLLDEFGPLELLEGRGLTAGLRCVDAREYRLACVVVRPELLAAALARWPWGQSFVIPQYEAGER